MIQYLNDRINPKEEWENGLFDRYAEEEDNELED